MAQSDALARLTCEFARKSRFLFTFSVNAGTMEFGAILARQRLSGGIFLSTGLGSFATAPDETWRQIILKSGRRFADMQKKILIVDDDPNIVVPLEADAYMTQPFSTKDLLAQVRQLLGENS